MIRTACFTLICLFALASQANAEFLIDSFAVLDTNEASGDAVVVHSLVATDIVVDFTTENPGTTLASGGFYGIDPTVASGAKMTLAYSWGGGLTFGDLQSISGLQIEASSLPVVSVGGNWNLLITDGTTDFYDGSLISFVSSSEIDSATSLTFEFELLSPSAFGASEIVIGGSRLFATPEPTGFLMLGCVGIAGLLRRRRS